MMDVDAQSEPVRTYLSSRRQQVIVTALVRVVLVLQIKSMIKKYVKKEETIILAVVPANVDVETNEALQMAKEVDSKGERTLGKTCIFRCVCIYNKGFV